MSEPSQAATRVDAVVEGVRMWTVSDDRIGGAPSSAVAVDEGPGSVVVINPLRLEERALRELGDVTAVLLTSSNHVRAAAHYREATGAALWAPAQAELGELEPDETFTEGNEVPGGLRVIALPGPSDAESAFYLKRGEGVMIIGDALRNIESFGGFQVLPKQSNRDPARTRQSLRKLLDYNFETMVFAHGDPIRRGAKQRLKELLAR